MKELGVLIKHLLHKHSSSGEDLLLWDRNKSLLSMAAPIK